MLGVAAAGLGIYLFDWYWPDIAAAVLLSVLVLKSGLAISREAWRQWRNV
ncbi:MAG: hypothetical protein Q4A49_00275 [Neisseria sp.]|nr:hypothetical protein [Neisseria sp.]